MPLDDTNNPRELLNMLVSSLKLSMSFSRVNDRYADYKTLIRRMYPRLDTELSELITDVMESLDPTPEMPPEVRYKRNLERKPTPREAALSIYDNPKYFPPQVKSYFRSMVIEFRRTHNWRRSLFSQIIFRYDN